jgi:hypothetical protein
VAGHPGTLPLRLYRGDSYSWQVRVWLDDAHTEPMPLDGVSAAAAIGNTETGSVIVLGCAVTLPNLIDVALPATTWNGVTTYDRWDLQLSWDDGRVYTLLAGPVTVQDDVTP